MNTQGPGMTYAIAAGCSHTAGTGNNISDCYVSCLERHYTYPILNHAVPGGSCNDVLLAISHAVQKNSYSQVYYSTMAQSF